MTIQWTGFPASTTAVSGDVLVGLLGGTANARFNAQSFLFKASNLSDVANKTTACNNLMPTTTKGDLIWNDGTNNARLAVGTVNQLLSVGASSVLTWIANPSLLIASNLSDLANAATARTNLGLGAASNVAFLNVFAGASGAAGVFRSYPSTASKGYLGITGVANTGDTAVVISNALHGQVSTYTIPDGGQTASNFLISNSSGTQTIATGNLALTLGYTLVSHASALTAHSGGGQSSALQLAKQINRVSTVAAPGDSVKLPVSVAGMQITVTNASLASAMDCFPSSGEIINALSADTALSIATNSTVVFSCSVAGIWNSVVTA